jgi:L-alanine-DL-glutamate epimerase-like enolase superfamily enzyme
MTSRRQFLTTLAAGALAPAIHAKDMPTDVRIQEVGIGYEDYHYRTPIKFGGTEVNQVTLLNVNAVLESRAGKVSKGFGSMPLGNVWAFPSKTLTYQQTLDAMKALSRKIERVCNQHKEYGHPVDLNIALEEQWLKAAADVDCELSLAQPIPKLCTLVTGSPFDAAVQDAFGRMLGRNTFATYGPDLMRHDLSHYLTPEFKGEYLQKYVLTAPKPSMPLYHLVGAVDPITGADVKKRINDGLPETLPEWIQYSGLTHIKIKLNGEDLQWDTERVLAVDKAASETQAKRGVKTWFYSLDFNEKCPNVAYLMDMLGRIRSASPAGYARIQYVEQPTKRDLRADKANVMHKAAELKPVVIDESLTDLEALQMAREMGYTGTALKACKGQAQAVLMAAAAQKWKMFLCVQDLTCPGASLIHSAALAAHIPGVAAIEANSRQYVPAANKGWEQRYPGIFDVRNGRVNTALLKGPGLSVRS